MRDPGESCILLLTMLSRPPLEHYTAVDDYLDVTAAFRHFVRPKLLYELILPQTSEEGTDPTVPSPELMVSTSDGRHGGCFLPMSTPLHCRRQPGRLSGHSQGKQVSNCSQKCNPVSMGDLSIGDVVDGRNPGARLRFGSAPSGCHYTNCIRRHLPFLLYLISEDAFKRLLEMVAVSVLPPGRQPNS